VPARLPISLFCLIKPWQRKIFIDGRIGNQTTIFPAGAVL